MVGCVSEVPIGRARAVWARWASSTAPPNMTICVETSEIKPTQLTYWTILYPHMQGLNHVDHGTDL